MVRVKREATGLWSFGGDFFSGMNTIQNIFLAAIFICLLIAGFFIYAQGQRIALLEKQKNGVAEKYSPPTSAEVLIGELNEIARKEVVDTTKNILGEIISIENDVIMVRAMTVNEGELEKIDFSKPYTLSLIEKTYAVKPTKDTVFFGKKSSELGIGDNITVFSDASVLFTDTIFAKQIFYSNSLSL